MSDEFIKLMLVNCIVHLIEHIDTGEQADLIAAMGNLASDDVYEYIERLDPAVLPIRRDGKPPVSITI